MKILQIFGAVVAVHLLAFIFIFASPGCQSSPRNVPTPDATLPPATEPAAVTATATAPAAMPAADAGTVTFSPELAPGRAEPTRPGSPNAVALTPAKASAEKIAPVSTYTVQHGDSLWSIAKKHHLKVAELAAANNLGAGSTLLPGKKLIIPGRVAASAPAAPMKMETMAPEKTAAPVRPAGIDAVKHIVQPGETLGAIARKYQVKFGELAAANGITDPARIRVGQELTIPGFKAPAGKAATPARTAATPAEKPAAPADTAAANTPHFDLNAPPPGQDLDAGLKSNTATDVPTIKVEDGKASDSNGK